jgi:hypothetical protein
MCEPAGDNCRRVLEGPAASKNGEEPNVADYEALTPLQHYASEHRLAIVLGDPPAKWRLRTP